MAKFEARLSGNFDDMLRIINDAVMDSSSTASLEDSSDFCVGGSRCAVRIYERFSYTGSNRVSLSVTLFQADGFLFVSAIASGGSQAVLFKINTFGEEAFLNTLSAELKRYII